MTLIGTETGVEANRLTSFGRFVECPGSTYTWHAVGGSGFISSGATTATITPIYKQVTAAGAPNCKGSSGASNTIDMNGCDYVLHLGATTGGVAGTYGVTFDVVCPAGKEITVTMWYTENGHTNNPASPNCVLHMPPQTGLKGAHATDTGNGHIDLAGTVEGITLNQTRPNDPLFQCTKEHEPAAQFDLDVTVAGHNEAGGATAVSLSESVGQPTAVSLSDNLGQPIAVSLSD